jgi:hypothetical protein
MVPDLVVVAQINSTKTKSSTLINDNHGKVVLNNRLFFDAAFWISEALLSMIALCPYKVLGKDIWIKNNGLENPGLGG